MKKPNPLNRKKLQHPKDERSSWNGDVRRPRESQGFSERRAALGLTTDTTPPGQSTRRAFINGHLVEEPALEVIPIARPIVSQQPKRIPVAGRDIGPDDVVTLPPGVRIVERTDG